MVRIINARHINCLILTELHLRILSSTTQGMAAIPPLARAFSATVVSSGLNVEENMEQLVAEMQNLRAATQDVSCSYLFRAGIT